MDRRIKKLVVDTGAFVKRLPLWEYAEDYYCVGDVYREIRDKHTRQYIDSLPVQIINREPSSSSIKFINDFAKKSGDYASLSLADVKILALTYELESEAYGGTSHLRSEPLKNRTEQQVSRRFPTENIPQDLEGFYRPTKDFSQASIQGSSPLPPLESVENETEISADPLDILDAHLFHHTYVRGHVISEVDLLCLNEVRDRYPLLKKFTDIFDLHKKGNNLNLLIILYRNYVLNIDKKNGRKEPEVKSFVSVEREGLSESVVKAFAEEFSHLPHFVRWLIHILSQDEMKQLNGSTGDDLTFDEVLHDLWAYNSEEILTSCELVNISEGLEDVHITQTNEVSEDMQCNSNGQIEDLGINGCDIIREDTNEDTGEGNVIDEDEDYSSYGSDNDDDEGWITPSNIKGLKQRMADPDGESDEKLEVACVTIDYSMQNTLKHIGLNVIGIDGRLINQVRTFILRCHACFKTTDKMEKIFCPNCGHKALKRVSVTLNPDGTQKIWISSKKPINIRGMKFTLPRPRGGKHAVNPILVADQREAQQRASKLARMKTDPLNDDYDTRGGCTPFVTRDVYSRSAQLGIKSGNKHTGMFYWEQKNPNVPMSKGKSRRKKR